MNGKRALAIRIIVLALMGLVWTGCGRRESGNRVRVLCGTSMAQPMQEIADAFKEAKGVVVEFDLGGSETLLPKVLLGSAGDVYVCHDPFEAKVREAGKLSESVVTGWLCPIVVTQVGNPKRIRDWDDLAKPGLRLGIGDPRYSTCGEMFVAELRRRGLEERVMRNVVVQMRTHGELATGVTTDALDAASVWNFVAPQYPGKLEQTAISADYPEIRVTVLGLDASAEPALRDEFLKWCGRPESLALFAKHGYSRLRASGGVKTSE
jgi:molybdate transport system substrate-binding protein